MYTNEQLSIEIRREIEPYTVCMFFDKFFCTKYFLIRVFINNKTEWGIYTETPSLLNILNDFRRNISCVAFRNFVCYEELTTRWREKIVTSSILFDTLYACQQYIINNKYPTVFINDVNAYINNSINMNYMV